MFTTTTKQPRQLIHTRHNHSNYPHSLPRIPTPTLKLNHHHTQLNHHHHTRLNSQHLTHHSNTPLTTLIRMFSFNPRDIDRRILQQENSNNMNQYSKVNSAYHSVAPPRDKYSNQTYFGQLVNNPSDHTYGMNYYTQNANSHKKKYPLVNTIINPFRSMWQRILFVILPRSDHHQNRRPLFVPLERFLNKMYHRWRTFHFTRPTKIALRWPKRLLWLSIFTIGGAITYKNTRPNPLKEVVIDGYEYQPEYPDHHIPFRSSLLPHTLPTHLSGTDSRFVGEFNHDYDLTQIIRPKEIRKIERPTFAYGRVSKGLYSTAVRGWGTDKNLGGGGPGPLAHYNENVISRKPLVDDVPKRVDRRDVYTPDQHYTQQDMSNKLRHTFFTQLDNHPGDGHTPTNTLAPHQQQQRMKNIYPPVDDYGLEYKKQYHKNPDATPEDAIKWG